MSRVFLIVLDGFGIGNAPDAEKFGDNGSNTLKSLHNSGLLKTPNLKKMGLYEIDGVDFQYEDGTTMTYLHSSNGRLIEKSNAKDTISGHWEMMGIISKQSPPTFPNGFPENFVKEFEKRIGRKCICNKPYSGTDVIRDYGDEHVKTGDVILYTSADSVCQIATHTDIVSLEELYDMCKIAREMLVGDLSVGRVIARPFCGESGNYQRVSEGRHDYGLIPPYNLLNKLVDNKKQVFAVGKINDIFSGSGITWTTPNEGNKKNMEKTTEIIIGTEFQDGLCFVNLVDFDMIYGHRRDVEGYTKCLNEFDEWLLDGCIRNLRDDDVVIITGDHGCDPSFSGSDHTRECVPILIYENKRINYEQNLGTIEGFDYIAKRIENHFNI